MKLQMKPSPYNTGKFSVTALWKKLSKTSKRLGQNTVEKILWLYYASQRPQTPKWAKTLIYSALAYFILPVDAIPDIIPISGYADDLAAITAALTTIAVYIDDGVKQKTSEKINQWFGKDDSSSPAQEPTEQISK